jgi:hypothetical protein
VYDINAQKISVSFSVKNKAFERLPGTAIRVNGDTIVRTNDKGTAIATVTPGSQFIQVTSKLYDTLSLILTIEADTSLELVLYPRYKRYNEVVVTSSKNVTANQMGRQTIGIDLLRKLPVILGEIDPLKTITLLPGIKGGGEASSGIYVRGGGPDQNLVLLDGVPVYNPNHLLGFFSIFNGEAIQDIEVIKGNMPAEYGGRLSSVIAINTRDPNKTRFKTSGGIGAISLRLSAEMPIIKNKSGIIVSARRTYFDQVAKPFAKDRIGGNGYFFHDINAKADYIVNAANKLDLIFYTGIDNFTFSNNNNGRTRVFNTEWGNTLAGLNWRQDVSSKIKHTTGAIFNDFSLDSRFGFSTLSFLFASGVKDYQLKSDWQYTPNLRLKVKWGAQYIWHQFKPGAGGVTAGVQQFKSQITNQYAREAAAYISSTYNITEKLNVVAGIRYSYFNQVGPTERIIYGSDNVPTGERITYKRGESVAAYQNPEPRLNLLYKLNNNSSIKLAYSQAAQYLHLATTSGATFPSDLWIPSSKLIKPGLARQIALGYFTNLKDNYYELNAEIYYKTLTNQLEFKPGAQLLLNQNLEGEMVFGSGKAYGIELFFQKKRGRLTGWVGYTLSRAERTFEGLNEGKPFPYRYDRTHDISLVANYVINKKWEFSSVFVYGTGNALTLPNGRVTYNLGFDGNQNLPILTNINQYAGVNDYRMPAYHRMDISFTYTRKTNTKRRYKSSWNFSIYNIYNRYNPFFIYLDADENTRTIQGKKVFLFPIIPSITWNFKID